MDPSPSSRPVGFREVWKELGNSLSNLGLQKRGDDESASRGSSSRKPSVQIHIPSASILTRNPQIVVGVLFKNVSLASGWRPRLFVLQDGVLKYFKVYGPTAVNVFLLLDSLRQQGDIFPIGAEVSVLEAQDERAHRRNHPVPPFASGGTPSAAETLPLPQPRAEVHMQVGTVRESNSDGRKFYIHSGTSTMTLRSETQDDRLVWIEALRAAKGAWDGLSPIAAGAMSRHQNYPHYQYGDNNNNNRQFPQQECKLRPSPEEVRTKLSSMGSGMKSGISGPALEYVTETLDGYCLQYHELALAEENKRLALMDLVYQLENDKRQLETALVVEAAGDTNGNGLGNGDGSEGDEGANSTSSTAGLDRLDSLGGALQVRDEEEEEEDEFFECETFSMRSHSRTESFEEPVVLYDGGGGGGAAAAFVPHERQPQIPSVRTIGPPAVHAVSPEVRCQVEESPSDEAPSALTLKGGLTDTVHTTPAKSELDWMADEGPPPVRRTCLPPPRQREKSISLWALIKEMVGKDLTRVCLPVYFNEPLSALEKTAEDLEYSELLDQAATLPPGSVDRLLRVTAFAISAYSSTVGRTAKPFNPLLGETYELVHVEKGFRFIAEKVSHHPTIIAAHARGRAWTFEGDAEVKSKFWGRSIELKPEGVLRLTFDDGDSYAWNKVTTSINNLILGKIYVDHGGIMRVRCVGHPGGLCARVRFKETGVLFDKDPRQVRAFLEMNGTKLDRPQLFGHWDQAIVAEMENDRVVELWRKNPPPPDPTRYNLTSFAIELNELTPGLRDLIAPTDCRLRPDQTFTETGMWDEANAEKQRLEHKQRAARKAADRGDPIKPRWFDVLPTSSVYTASDDGAGAPVPGKARQPHDLAFKYKGGYWEARKEGNYVGCRDIFGPNVEE